MKNIVLLGAIIGDMIGSIYESRHRKVETKNFKPLFDEEYCHFTDDTVCTIAIAEWLLKGGEAKTYLKKWARKYPHAGYGKGFKAWFQSDEDTIVDSWGNGSAMRVSPCGFVSESLDETLEIAKQSAMNSHAHTEGIKGAQATAACIWMARHGKNKNEIKEYVEKKFDYDLSRDLSDIKKTYTFSSWCQTSVPESIICFLQSDSYEETVRNAVYLNGDTDTMAAISGAIALAYYDDIDKSLIENTLKKLPNEMIDIIMEFNDKFLKN